MALVFSLSRLDFIVWCICTCTHIHKRTQTNSNTRKHSLALSSFIFTVSFWTLGRSTTLIQSKFSGQIFYFFIRVVCQSIRLQPTWQLIAYVFSSFILCLDFFSQPFTVLQMSTAHFKLARQNPKKSNEIATKKDSIPSALYHRIFILIFPFFISVKCFNGHLWRCDMIFEYANFNGINLHI